MRLFECRTAICPDAVRILLTGHADIEAAIRAVNDGSIFHYLTKPCPIETLKPILDDAIALYERKVEERIVLEETFWSSVEVMDVAASSTPRATAEPTKSKLSSRQLSTSNFPTLGNSRPLLRFPSLDAQPYR